jgi:hypothetical protein
MFNNGLLTVEDMDDEELRAGRMRDSMGRIPKVTKTMENVPRDLYDAMVQEHQQRTQERYRQTMDAALDTIVDIMLDDTVEPRDRLEAAKHVKEQVMGKTPDKVQLAVTRAPWEDIVMEVGRMTRAEHAARQAAIASGVIDAEVVEEAPTGEEVRARPAATDGPDTGTTPPGGLGGQHCDGVVGDPRITPAPAAPSYNNPATNSPEPTPSNSDIIAAQHCDMLELAARRAAAKKRIQGAKKQRIIKRAMGAMGAPTHNLATTCTPDPSDPTTGKLTHTLTPRD